MYSMRNLPSANEFFALHTIIRQRQNFQINPSPSRVSYFIAVLKAVVNVFACHFTVFLHFHKLVEITAECGCEYILREGVC